MWKHCPLVVINGASPQILIVRLAASENQFRQMKQQVAQRQLHHHPHHHYHHLGGGKQQQTLVYRWTNMFDESEPVSALSKIRNLCSAAALILGGSWWT